MFIDRDNVDVKRYNEFLKNKWSKKNDGGLGNLNHLKGYEYIKNMCKSNFKGR